MLTAAHALLTEVFTAVSIVLHMCRGTRVQSNLCEVSTVPLPEPKQLLVLTTF